MGLVHLIPSAAIKPTPAAGFALSGSVGGGKTVCLGKKGLRNGPFVLWSEMFLDENGVGSAL